jgi:hypothetical protein
MYILPLHPVKGAVSGNNASDTGAIYALDLHVPVAGDHILLVRCLTSAGVDDAANGATLFRNNLLTGATYPMGIPNVMSFTGNSATNQESQFYYFFYDMKIKTEGCASDRVTVVAPDAPVPSVSQVADSLVSTIATGNQWYKDNVLIIGATARVSNLP